MSDLRTLLGGYLGYDWPEDHGDVDRAVAAFTADHDVAVRRTVVDEIDQLLGTTHDEQALSAYFDEMHSGVDPAGLGQTHQAFLRWLREQVEPAR